jgi:hypothetical protein
MESAGEVAIGISVELILVAIALGVLYRFLGRFFSVPHRQAVLSFQRGVLLHGERVEKVLLPGTYWIKPKRTLMLCDMRPKPFQVLAQELLTADGMVVRISLGGEYRVAAPESFLTQSSDAFGALYLDLRQALRTATSELNSAAFLSEGTPLVARINELLVPRSQQLGIELVRLEVSESSPLGWPRGLTKTVRVECPRLRLRDRGSHQQHLRRSNSPQLRKHSCRFCQSDHECLRIDGRRDEAIFLVEFLGVSGDCVHQNGSDSSDLRCLHHAQNGIAEKIGSNPTALKAGVDGKPSNQDHWHGVGHIALCP